MYLFLRETQIILEYGNRQILLDTVSEISCDQTFKEISYNRRTLHNKNKFFKYSRIRGHNTISGSISLHLTKSFEELILLELAGWTNFTTGYAYPDFESIVPETFSLYLNNAGQVYKLSNCIITQFEMSMNKSFVGNFTVAFEASKMEEVSRDFPTLVYQGDFLTPTPLVLQLGSYQGLNITSIGTAFKREIQYLGVETIHNSYDLVENNKAIITDASFNINVNTYFATPNIDSVDVMRFSQNGITITIDNALITRRTSIDDVLKSSFDVTPTNLTTSINILI